MHTQIQPTVRADYERAVRRAAGQAAVTIPNVSRQTRRCEQLPRSTVVR
ncbi:MAG: hypothetical protein LC116_05610 [Bacteroidetes bacterium]|nr:hypothetical protein [Bacteroidota bacterium]MCZ2132517.1 hypothetical protein [Bacteroidota bacterium]MCZ2132648.1 hypothetical protein [Bacteroidota bacterium]MCZ2132652.1 hypothetical protein [Bacteroidota bacterium]MCZ2132655.1 hypothetical protein [Bacteroidota bacterium]